MPDYFYECYDAENNYITGQHMPFGPGPMAYFSCAAFRRMFISMEGTIFTRVALNDGQKCGHARVRISHVNIEAVR